jgi:hypothetical protein
MEVSSVSSAIQNTNAVQQQNQPPRAKDVESNKDKDDVVSKTVAEKEAAQKVSTDKANSQKLAERISEEQVSTRPSPNGRGQIVGTIIDAQA